MCVASIVIVMFSIGATLLRLLVRAPAVACSAGLACVRLGQRLRREQRI